MQSGSGADVDVCVCTFRRPCLWETLLSLKGQEGAPSFRVIVADNDDEPSAQAIAHRAEHELDLRITYVHAPARNISVARNACLETSTADLVAFIDDDEIAPPQWLACLVDHQRQSNADVVFGPVKAVYEPNAPAWVVEGDFHSSQPVVRASGAIETGYSGNALMRRAVIGDRRFGLALGKTGGEDTFFFAELFKAGARLDYCEAALVYETTPLARANLDWLVRRAFRSGQTHARVLRANGVWPLAIAAPAAAKSLYSVLVAATAFDGVKWRRSWIRAALHAGVLAKAFGVSDLRIYGAR